MRKDKYRRIIYKLDDKGFSLVELLISIAVLVIIMVPLMSNFIRSMQMNRKAGDIQLQSNLAASIAEGFKAKDVKDIIEEFNGTEPFDIIPASLIANPTADIADPSAGIIRLQKNGEAYERISSDTVQDINYLALHDIKLSGKVYDALVTLDATPYQRTDASDNKIETMNYYPMPEVINLDDKANGLLFSNGEVKGQIEAPTLDEKALDNLVSWGTQYAQEQYYNSAAYQSYLTDHGKWQEECEKAAIDGTLVRAEPTPPPMPGTLLRYTDPEAIKAIVTKTMQVTITGDNKEIDYNIEYKCSWWDSGTGIKDTITNLISVTTYDTPIVNVYMFYIPSIFQASHNADVIDIQNGAAGTPGNPVNLFVANQLGSEINFNVAVQHEAEDNITIYTDINTLVTNIPADSINTRIVKTNEEDRIFDIKVRICESNPADRYKKVLYTLDSTLGE